MARVNGIHHLAISTGDMKMQLQFFSEVLGAEVKALYWMHGVPNTFHGFVRLHDSSYIAFVQGPTTGSIEPVFGISHAGNAGAPSAPGTMQHVAINVDTLDELVAMRDRIRSHGVQVYGPIDHGMCHSIYFAGPENLALEVATSEVAIDERAWIDPEVVALLDINAAELAALTAPTAFVGEGGGVLQPAANPERPHLTMDPVVLSAIMSMSDEAVAARLSHPAPPVAV